MENKKIKLLFDMTFGSYMEEKTGMRGGIFFVTKNLLENFAQNPEISVTLYCDYKRQFYLESLLAKGFLPENCKIFDCKKSVGFLPSFISYLGYKYRKINGKDNIFKKAVRFFIFRFFHFYDRHKKISKRMVKNLKNFNVYFSPYEPVLPEVKLAKNVTSYLFLHDTIPIVMKELYQNYDVQNKWFDLIVKSIDRNSMYFANSEHTKKDFIKYVEAITPENIVVAPLGANENFYRETDKNKINKIKEKYGIPQDKKYLFSLCTLEPRKNLIFAIKNFIEFTKKNNINDFIFVLGGGSWHKVFYELEKSISNFDEYKDKILKIGYVEDEDLGILYSGAEMFVYPSFYEGFGMPILEAMQCGCPVICSNTSSMPEVIGDCGIMIDPRFDSDLISAFEKMYFDEDFRNSCREKGLARAKTFSWEKCASIIIEKIKSDLN